MKTPRCALAVPVLALLGLLAATPAARADGVVIDPDTYAAVAYSPSTGKYGYGYNCGSRWAAERRALAECQAPDARVVGWVNAGWLVLAIGDDNSYGVAWEYGDGASSLVAKRRAVANCREQGGKVVKVICLCSGDVPPEVIE